MHHCHAVACRNDRRGGGGVDVAHTTGGKQGEFGQVCVNLVGLRVEGVDTVTFDVGRVLCNALAQMVLGDYVDSKLILFQFDVGVVVDGLQQSALDLGTRIVLVVQDSELGMATFAVQIELAALRLVEFHAVMHQLFDALGRLADGHFNHIAVADAVAGNEGVGNVLVETVGVVHHGGNTALGILGRAFGGVAFGEDAHLAVGCHFECKAQPGNTGANHKKINLMTHICVVCRLLMYKFFGLQKYTFLTE